MDGTLSEIRRNSKTEMLLDADGFVSISSSAFFKEAQTGNCRRGFSQKNRRKSTARTRGNPAGHCMPRGRAV